MSADEPLSLDLRLDAVRLAAQRDAVRSPEAMRELLARRARQLARPLADGNDAIDDPLDLLIVEVASEHLAIPLESIVAIARAGSTTPLPRAVAPVFGVTAWRGRPLTVLTLAPGAPASDAEARLIVLGSGSRAALAIAADAVHDVTRIARGSLGPVGPGPRAHYALGVSPDGILVVDGNALLHPEALST